MSARAAGKDNTIEHGTARRCHVGPRQSQPRRPTRSRTPAWRRRTPVDVGWSLSRVEPATSRGARHAVVRHQPAARRAGSRGPGQSRAPSCADGADVGLGCALRNVGPQRLWQGVLLGGVPSRPRSTPTSVSTTQGHRLPVVEQFECGGQNLCASPRRWSPHGAMTTVTAARDRQAARACRECLEEIIDTIVDHATGVVDGEQHRGNDRCWVRSGIEPGTAAGSALWPAWLIAPWKAAQLDDAEREASTTTRGSLCCCGDERHSSAVSRRSISCRSPRRARSRRPTGPARCGPPPTRARRAPGCGTARRSRSAP